MRAQRRLIGRGQAAAIHAALVELAHAPAGDDALRDFVRHATRDMQVEYRFQGRLGFGGKFYWDGWQGRVGFYPEHRTALREAVRDCLGVRIARILGTEPPAKADSDALLAACADSMEAMDSALEGRERVVQGRRDPDPAARPKRGAMARADAHVREARAGLQAACLRARECLAAGDADGPPGAR